MRDYRSKIVRDLEPNDILSELVTVLTEMDEVEIRLQSTRQERCDKLLEILPRRGENAFEVFVKALKKVDHHLAYVLIEAGNKEDPNQSSALGDRSIHYVT